MNSPKPAKINAASNRNRKDAGRAASGPGGLFGGPGGSSTPIPEDLCGGPPTRDEDACGSSSSSHSRDSYGIQKCYRRQRNASSATCIASEQAKHGFNGDPSGDGSMRPVSRWNKLPAPHGFHCALVEAKPDALYDSDILRSPVLAHENLQRHRTLHLAMPSIIGVSGDWTICTSRRNKSRHVLADPRAVTRWPITAVAYSITIARTHGVAFAGAR